MNQQLFEQARELAAKTDFVIVATASDLGQPHIASAGGATFRDGGTIDIIEWFCPGTVQNLTVNKRLAAVVWDRAADVGFQLLGEVEGIEAYDVMDGYDPAAEPVPAMPQVQRRVVVRVTQVLRFAHGPHSDLTE
ncbi:MAG: pyridoxamine 5'-phosphate oxidase family protein [Planctomycetaceae bacterium]|nr:pyridoxamine 5'-phosphate oxidase family protein [Planctomycetaceae bacterium]